MRRLGVTDVAADVAHRLFDVVTAEFLQRGVGLRFGLTRSGLGNVIHVDLAFPLDGDPSITRAEVHIVTKNSF